MRPAGEERGAWVPDRDRNRGSARAGEKSAPPWRRRPRARARARARLGGGAWGRGEGTGVARPRGEGEVGGGMRRRERACVPVGWREGREAGGLRRAALRTRCAARHRACHTARPRGKLRAGLSPPARGGEGRGAGGREGRRESVVVVGWV